MAFCKYVKHKPGHNYWVYQRRVPTPLVELIGKTTWYQSLKTEAREVAHRRGLMIDADVEAEIARAYRILEGKPLTGDEISKMGETHFERTNAYLDNQSSRIVGDDAAIMRRAMPPTPTPNDLAGFIAWANSDASNSAPGKEPDPDFLRKGAQARLVTLLRCLEDGDYSLVQTFADHFYELQGLATRHRDPIDPDNPTTAPVEWVDIDRRSTDYQALSHELMLKEIAAVKRQLVQLSKAEVGWIDPPTQIIAPATPERAIPMELHPDASKTPSQLVERFSRDSREARGASSLRSFTTAISRFEQVTGKKPIAMITKNDVIEFYDLFSQCPQKYRTRLGVSTMREAIEKNMDAGIPVNSVATIKKEISHLRCFFEWARKRNLIAANPVGELSIEGGKKPTGEGDASKTYSADELNAIFKLKPFTVQASERGYRFWVPLVALFTGTRMGEVCQLDIADVRQEGELNWFDFHERNPDQSIKTGRPREVPIHAELIRIGFLDYVKRQKAKGERKLFPDAPRGAESRNAYQPVSQWFAKLLTDAKLKRPGVNLHAFRHTFITACRNSGIPKDMAEALVGHKNDSVHDGYGDPVGLERRADAVKKLAFKGVDLDHLHP